MTDTATAGAHHGSGGGRSHPEGLARLAAMSPGELAVRYRSGAGLLDRRLFDLSDEQADATFDPDRGLGRWPVRLLLGHVADAELVYAHRLRRTIAEDRPVLTDWDENTFIDGGLYAKGSGAAGLSAAPPVGGFVAMLYTTRQWLGEWLMALDPSAWDRTAMHPWYGASTVHEMLAMVTWHFEHHVGFLRRKLDHMVGPIPAGGCCSERGGCACEAEGKAKPEDGGCCGGGGDGGGGGCSTHED